MRFRFGLHDFLGYAVPGLVVIVILAILINPELLKDLLDQPKDGNSGLGLKDLLDQLKDGNSGNSGLGKILPANVAEGIFYLVACYLAGFASHGLINGLFGRLLKICEWFNSKICERFKRNHSDHRRLMNWLLKKCEWFNSKIYEWSKRFHSDHGSFEKGLFCRKYRKYPEDFGPYSKEFVCKLKRQIEKVFDIKVETVLREARKAENNVKYTEIFHLCRTALMKQSRDLYPRASGLLIRYNSAKLLGGIFFLGAIGFFLRGFVYLSMVRGFVLLFIVSAIYLFALYLRPVVSLVLLSIVSAIPDEVRDIVISQLGSLLSIVSAIPEGSEQWFFGVWFVRLFIVSVILCHIFFHLYHVFFRYYRNSILYGFYEYAVNLEKWEESEKRKN